MVLRDWLIQNYTSTPATVATTATVNCLPETIVANVAIVAAASTEIVKKQSHKSIDLQELIAIHQPIIDGCKLSDILDYAVQEDYEDLFDPNVLSIFARSLRESGKLQVIESMSKSNE